MSSLSQTWSMDTFFSLIYPLSRSNRKACIYFAIDLRQILCQDMSDFLYLRRQKNLKGAIIICWRRNIFSRY
jgi:hypothetical protein